MAALAWAYLKWSPMPMPGSSGGLRTTHYLAVTFLMWFVMMVGMMVPSVAPTVLLFDRMVWLTQELGDLMDAVGLGRLLTLG